MLILKAHPKGCCSHEGRCLVGTRALGREGMLPCRDLKAEENLMYELGFQKLLSHSDTKPRASCVCPGPSYVKSGTGVSLEWGSPSGAGLRGRQCCFSRNYALRLPLSSALLLLCLQFQHQLLPNPPADGSHRGCWPKPLELGTGCCCWGGRRRRVGQ